MRRSCIGLLLLALSFPSSLLAEDTGVSGTNLEFYRPSIDPYGYFGVNGPRLLRAGEPFFKISQGFSLDSLFEIAVNGAPVDIVDRIATTNFIASVGIADFMTLGVDLPAHLYAREANFDTLAPFTTTTVGDIRMAMKFRLMEENNRRPGISLLVTNTFPTGNERKFLGTSHMVPGAELIVGKDFKHVSVAANMGALFPQQKDVLGINFDDQILYGAAVKVPLGFWDPLFSILGEIRGYFEPNKVQTLTAPVEFTAGIQKEFRNGLIVNAGAGGGWNNAIGNPKFRGIISLGYAPRIKWSQEKPKKETDLANRIRTTAYFAFGSSRPTPESAEWIREAAQLIRDHPEIKSVSVEGHTDSVGGPSQNLRLSNRRAEEVKGMLGQEGVDPVRMETKGMGEDQPAASNQTSQGRRLNRRVEIFVK